MHATDCQSRARRNGVPRAESRRGADAAVSYGRRLRGLGASPSGNAAAGSHAKLCLLLDAQSLALGSVARTGWPTVDLPAAGDQSAHTALAGAKRRVGYGHLYQGRFKSFPVDSDDHFYSLVRYVERNALRAGLVARAEDWPWSSLSRRTASEARIPLSTWPLPRPSRWTTHVNQPQTEGELEAIRRCLRRGRPYGAEAWTTRIAHKLGLESTLRPRGRPRKQTAKPR